MKPFANIILLLSLLCLTSLTSGCSNIMMSAATKSSIALAQKRSVGNAIDDFTIWSEIKHAYIEKDVNELLKEVNVEVLEQRVILTGAVSTPQTRIDAIRLAWKPAGVREVINEISIEQEESLSNIIVDKMITTQFKGKLLLSKALNYLNYSIETIDGTIYLMGIAENEYELREITHLASTIKGVKKVVSYIRLKRPPKIISS